MSAKRKAASEEQPTATDYTVLARRYRPQQFSDLIGQEPVAQALVNALKSNRVAHAYLFTGARGVGKTSTARILAKALNCEQGPTPTPCDRCDICKGIASGEDVDVLEIDGASNRGIDEIREIRQNVQYRPSRSRYKIYIVDEVHMLTPAAFNALLKTLEEPPAHVKFILATTEVQKIPVTILSRCQRFDFAGIGTQRIVERLRLVVDSERMQADDDALELVARRAGGSMRDAQSLLDQLLAFGGERLTSEQVHQLLGTAHADRVMEVAAAVLNHDAKQALKLVGEESDRGLQLSELVDQLIEYWRDLMVVHCAGADSRDLSVPARHRETLKKQAEALKLDTILAGLDILSSTKARLRGSNHGRVLIEMALVRLGRLDQLIALTELAQRLQRGEAGEDRSGTVGTTATKPATTNTPVSPTSNQTPSLPAIEKKKGPEEAELKPAETTLDLTQQTTETVWRQVLTQVGPMLANEMEKAEIPAIFGPNTLVIRFPPEYNLQREHCEEPTRRTRIEEVLRKLTGKSWNLRIESVPGAGTARPSTTVESTESSQSRYRRQREEAEKEPLVKRALEVLGAQIVRQDEGFGAALSVPPERAEATDTEEL